MNNDWLNIRFLLWYRKQDMTIEWLGTSRVGL